MASPISLTLGPYAAANAALFAASQTPVSGTPLTLTGTAADVPRTVLLTYGNEAAARQMLITGTINALGEQAQELLSIPAGAGGTVATFNNYLKVTKALPLGGGWTAAVTLGTVAANSGPWKFINAAEWGPTEVTWNVVATGTVNWSIVLTNTDLNANSNLGGPFGDVIPTPNIYAGPSGLTSQTGSASGVVNDPFVAWKAVVNSGTGSIVVEAIEAGAH
jgi:hypothetical protein